MKLQSFKFKSFVPFGDGEFYMIYEGVQIKRFLWFKYLVKVEFRFSMYCSIAQCEAYLTSKLYEKSKI